LFDSLSKESYAVINFDDENVTKVSKGIIAKRYSYSLKDTDADIYAEFAKGSSFGEINLKIEDSRHCYEVKAPLTGLHNAYNALAGIAIATLLGAKPTEITEGLLKVENDGKRFEIINVSKDLCIVNDCYNANPVSTESALLEVSKMEGNKFFVFGDMLELGEKSDGFHREIGRLASSLGYKGLFLLGEKSSFVKEGALEKGFPDESVKIFKSHEELSGGLKTELTEKSVVLIKGSRGMKMEKVTEKLLKEMKG